MSSITSQGRASKSGACLAGSGPTNIHGRDSSVAWPTLVKQTTKPMSKQPSPREPQCQAFPYIHHLNLGPGFHCQRVYTAAGPQQPTGHD
eukprot:scaffold34632_cov32-Prasinocladus_malaysianus.AAC.1